MSERDFQLRYMPQTAIHYKSSQQGVFGADTFVPKSHYKKFFNLEKTLHQQEIWPRDYAWGLSETLQEWVVSQGWRCLPFNVFCGDWAVGMFVEEVGNRRFIPPSSTQEADADLVYDELMVARMYIHNDAQMTIPVIVDMFDEALTYEWKYMYRVGRRGLLVARVLDILGHEYGIYALSYDDFVEESNG